MAKKIDLCEQCNATGLGMFIALILPTPSGCGSPVLPGWVAAPNVVSVALSGYQYALRSVRAGYVYVFFKKNSRGRNRWQVWDVSADGQLYPMANPAWAIPVADMMCRRSGHSPARLHHIVLEDPHLCETAWIAFSEHQWSDDTLKRYAQDEGLRGERMLKFEPAQLIASDGASSPGITPANVAALEAMCDYAPSFDAAKLPFGSEQAKPAKISTGDGGGFDATKLAFQSTRYPWPAGRKGTAAQACDMLMLRSRKKDGTPHPGVVVALPDAVGCTLEMNGYRNDVAGRIEQYGQERALQLSALHAIEGLKLALQEKAKASASDALDIPWQWDSTRSAERLKNVRAAGVGAERIANEEDLCRRWEQDAKARVPRSIAQRRSGNMAVSAAAYAADQARIDGEIAKRNAALQQPELAQRRQSYVSSAVAHAWPPYEKHIDTQAMAAFKGKHNDFTARAEALVNERTTELIKWLEAPAFIAALEDFHPANVADGVAFEDKVGSAILGMGSSPAGRAKIDAWVKELQASKRNLLWRAIALNQQAGMAELNEALQEAAQHQTRRTVADALTIEGYLAKSFKALADTYKRSVGVFNANTSAASPQGSTAFGAAIRPVNTRGFDKLAATVGDRVFAAFRVDALGDYLSEKAIQHVFTMRALVDPNDSINLIVAQAKNEGLARAQTLERVATARSFLAAGVPAVKTVQADALRRAWEDFKTKNGGANAVRDARLAVVVMLIEGVNFQKLLAECVMKNDAKSWWSLAASGVSITSALFDVASVPAKSLFGAESWSYQKLKLWGGVLGAGATAVAVVFDWKDAGKASDKGQAVLRYAYLLKFGANVTAVGLAAATTFTYAAPLIERLTGRATAGLTVRAIGARAAAIIGARILFMSAGAWITVGTLGIQGFIWIISDDKLQEWCSLSAFGRKRSAADAYAVADRQTEALNEALIEVGV